MKKQFKQEIHRCYPEDLNLTKEEIIKAFGLENYFKGADYFDKFSSLKIEKSDEYEGDTSLLCYGYRDETDQETTDRENQEAIWQKDRENIERRQFEALKAKFENK